MNRLYTLLFLLFIATNAFCQDEEATLYFIDGTSIDGYAFIKWDKSAFSSHSNDKIVFRVSKDEEPDEWDSSQVSRLDVHGYAYEKSFEYIPYVFNRKTYYNLMELVAEGEVNMYVQYSTVYDKLPAGFSGGSTPREVKSYFCKRKSEKVFTAFGGSKKKIAAYFKNCVSIVNKLATNEFNIGTLEDIVNFYNEICVGSDGYDEDNEEVIVEKETTHK